MGFNWSLYFCQRMVEATVMKQGLVGCRMLQERRAPPDFSRGELGIGVYVDGVAVIGTDSEKVRTRCQELRDALNACGLECGTEDHGDEEQVFTGLTIDRHSGRVSVAKKRLWRLRLAIDFVLKTNRMTGSQMRRIVGHITWCALLRRELLAVLASCYRFMETEGSRPLWASVREELF